MAVQPNTRRRYGAAGSDALSAAQRNGAKMLDVAEEGVQQGGDLAKATAKVAQAHANKMVDSGHAAVSDGITRSEKIARDAHDVVTASLPPKMVEKFPAIVQMIDGVHDLQVQSAEFLRRYIDRSIQVQRQALKSRSLPELSSLHQHYVMDNINDFASVSRSFLDVSARVAQQCAGDFAQRIDDASAQVQRRARA